MKKLIASFFLLPFAFANALQLPSQQSANVIKAVVDSVLTNNGLEFSSISKISISGDRAKVQLISSNNECLAIPYLIIANGQGAPSVKIDIAAIAICD